MVTSSNNHLALGRVYLNLSTSRQDLHLSPLQMHVSHGQPTRVIDRLSRVVRNYANPP